MSIYLDTIFIGIIVFIFLFWFILLLTWLLQYRANGHFKVFEGIIFMSFILYIEIAYFMTILPLPNLASMTDTLKPLHEYMQWNPFYFITDTAQYFANHGFHILAPPIYTTLFNIILLMPLGIYLKQFFQVKMPKIILISFLVSLSFEMIQLSGLLFIYPYPYRLFDINDLMFNTLGGYLGALIGTKYFGFLGKKTSILDTVFIVTKFKQFIIFISDLVYIFVVYVISNIIANGITMARHLPLTDNYFRMSAFSIIYAVGLIIFFILPLFREKYQTPAMIIAGVYLDREKDLLSIRFIRTIVLFLPFALSIADQNIPFIQWITYIYIIYLIVGFFYKKRGMNIIDKWFDYNLQSKNIKTRL